VGNKPCPPYKSYKFSNRYHSLIDAEPRQVDRDFEEAVKTLEKQPGPRNTPILK
jgi:hypothetical protein